MCLSSHFYPRPPRGGRRRAHPAGQAGRSISIHALREEGDVDTARDKALQQVISIHALREEGDVPKTSQKSLQGHFYPRPPRGGRRETGAVSITPINISIHALREEGDPMPLYSVPGLDNFYPRPPRGGRPGTILDYMGVPTFLSTPSARRATLLWLAERAECIPFLSTPSARRATLSSPSRYPAQ